MHLNKKSGFSLVEMLVSVAIIGILAVIVVVNLNSGKQIEQLSDAARQVAADIRSMQSRALSAGNVKTCPDIGGTMFVCDESTAVCANPAQCTGAVPAAFGINVTTTSSAEYTLFAEIEPTTTDYKYTAAHEKLATKKLMPIGTQDIEIQEVLSGKPAPLVTKDRGDISFSRQNGDVHMNDGSGIEPDVMVIRLKHKISNDTLDIEVNRITGRVSIL